MLGKDILGTHHYFLNSVECNHTQYICPQQHIKNMCVFGADLGLKSPGMACINCTSGVTTLGFVPQRKGDMTINHVDGDFCVKPFISSVRDTSGIHIFSESHFSAVVNVAQGVLRFIQTQLRECDNPKSSIIYIEGYAYGTQSSSSSRMYEVGGVVRYLLSIHGYKYEIVAPLSLKKSFTGNGRADKFQMYNVYSADVERPNLYALFRVREDCKSVPAPISDIVDAFALARWHTTQHSSTTTTHKRKRMKQKDARGE